MERPLGLTFIFSTDLSEDEAMDLLLHEGEEIVFSNPDFEMLKVFTFLAGEDRA